MTLSLFFKVYALCIPVFLVVDLLWIGVVAGNFYKRQIGYLLAENVNWPAAILFYLIYVAAVVGFAVAPALDKGLGRAVLLGAAFGFCAYATYDLTNLALVRDWPVKMAVVDMAWGTFLGAVLAASGYGFGRWLG